jgi:hypothetical protein
MAGIRKRVVAGLLVHEFSVHIDELHYMEINVANEITNCIYQEFRLLGCDYA